MNDYRVIFVRDGPQETREVSAETAKEVEALLPPDVDIVSVKFLRARGFSCRVRGTGRRQ